MAKTPRPGAVKTRLCPPLTAEAAAAIADAALIDTFDVVDRVAWTARVLALDSDRDDWDRTGWIRIRQCRGGLDRRIGHALESAQLTAGGAPVLLIGMDTPHLRVSDLRATRDALGCYDAVLGPAYDGGFWALGLRRADASLVDAVPMSTYRTASAQLARLQAANLTIAVAPAYRDIDTIDDALAASCHRPDARFAAAIRQFAGHRQ